MYLRRKFGSAALLLRIIGFGLAAIVSFGFGSTGLFALTAMLWLLLSGRIIRYVLLPALFPATRCPGCHRRLSLSARWECDHFAAGVVQHVLQFQTPEGIRIASFPCICGTTIVVQGRDPKRFRLGTAARLFVLDDATTSANQKSLILGCNENGRSIGVPLAIQESHVLLVGASGMGKTSLLLHLVDQLFRRGDGCTILDAKGDIALAAADRVPSHREGDAMLIDLQDHTHPFPLNILSVQNETEAALLAEELLQVFRRLNANSWGSVIEHQLRALFRTVMARGGNLRDVYRLCVDPAAVADYLPRITDDTLRAFWMHEFPLLPATRRMGVANKLAPILLQPVLRDILAARTCACDMDRLVATQKILIANLNAGTTTLLPTCLVGTFLVQKLLAAAIRQGRRPARERRRHFLIIDEFALFMDTADAAGFEQLLATARSFRLSVIIAHQHLDQLPLGVRAALFGNVSSIASFRVSPHDAQILAPAFHGFEPKHFIELGRGAAITRIGHQSTLIHTPRPLSALANNPASRIRATTRATTSGEDTPLATEATPIARPPMTRNEPEEFVR